MTERDERELPTADDGESPEPEAPPVSAAAVETARRLQGGRAFIESLPSTERRIATMAADGEPVWAIAQALGVSEAAIARTLDGVLGAIEGRELARVETGGLGADTEPGVTGGYGDTGFGSLDTESPAVNEEPEPDGDWPAGGGQERDAEEP